MIRIAALNDSSSESSNAEEVGPSQEALEAEATRVYRKAISLLARGETEKAKDSIQLLLKNPYIYKADWQEDAKRPKELPQDIALKYSCYKNLGNICMAEKKYDEACHYCLKAIHLDSSEVTLWQKLGTSAIKVNDFQLAVIAFQEGLLINPKHWPCVDQLLSVLFTLGFYEDCLGLAIETLSRDPCYVKALSFKDKIFELQPSLVSFVKEYFKGHEILFRESAYDKAKGHRFISNCMELRPCTKELTSTSRHSPFASSASAVAACRNVFKDMESLTWRDVTLLLNHTYDKLVNLEPKLFVESLDLEPAVRVYADTKLKGKINRDPNDIFMRGRRLCRSLSYNEDLLLSTKKSADTSKGSQATIVRRRQTIELGEGQGSFRVASRSSSSLDDGRKEREEDEEVVEDQEEEEEEEEEDEEEEEEELEAEGGGEVPPVITQTPSTNDEDKEEIEEEEEKEKEARRVIEDDEHEGLNEEEVEYMSGEPQRSAVDQLEDIMAMKPPSRILGGRDRGSGGEFEFDYCEYFDGGVYEEEDEEEEVDNEDMENVGEERESLQSDGGKDAKEPADSSDRVPSVAPADAIIGGESSPKSEAGESPKENITDETTIKALAEGGDGVIQTESDAHQSDSAANNEKPSEPLKRMEIDTAAAPPPKKPKRPKRGLERELEQLDYWGRRKAREAKRRRRTLTSKLVGGDLDDNEYLTWAHLIRSFIPASLLTLESPLPPLPNNSKLLVVAVESRQRVEDEEKDAPLGKPERDKADLLETFLGERFDATQWSNEEKEVGEFLCSQKKNGGIVHIMRSCLSELIRKFGSDTWTLEVAGAFKDSYRRISAHENVRVTLNMNENSEKLIRYAKMALTHAELLLSLQRLHVFSTNDEGEEEEDEERQQPWRDEVLLLIENDLLQLELLLARPDVWGKDYLQAHLRVMWVQAQLKIIQGLPEEGALFLQMLIEQISLSSRGDDLLEIERCKIEGDVHKINHPYLQNQLNSLQRSQMIENIESKFRAGHYGEVIQILTSLFKDPDTKMTSDDFCPPRHTQLLILVESLFKTSNVKGIIEWGSKCLNEAVIKFNCDEVDDNERNRWIDAISKLLRMTVDLVLSNPKSIEETSHDHSVNMISSLVNVLVIQLEQGASLPQPYFSTLSPWVILHCFLSEFEKKQKNSDQLIVSPSPPVETGAASLAPSTLLLITAHDELGKNEWCCLEEGNFLLYMLDVLLMELENQLADEQRQVLHQAVEQIVFCLFTHPSRKTKYKQIRDHGGQSIPLTWERALQLYGYYLPMQLPEFQSAQLPSISDDVAVLFRRILSLMPDEFKLADQMKRVDSFIDGEITNSEFLPFLFPEDLQDCYYLLADNYFKGKEWEQAIHYYKLDVSVNVNRIDSWAPMGLAKKAQLETVLNSCEVIKNTDEFFKEAQRAARCLERGLTLDQYFSNLWVEKGGLVYMIHSHASRLLNQDLNPDMSIEMFESLEKIKSEMLTEASRCFCRASKIVEEGWDDEDLPDERWLYQYMLGKLAEKTGKSPRIVLSYYLDAMTRLHNIGAKYPSKISYNNPLEYSVEVLEIYFRVHIYIFKRVTQRLGKGVPGSTMSYFKCIVEDLERSPFALGKEKTENENVVGKAGKEEQSSPTDECDLKRKSCDEGGREGKRFKVDVEDPTEGKKLSRKEKRENESEEVVGKAAGEELHDKKKSEIISYCLNAFKLCITRFPHHYKSLYRMAHFYHNSKLHKDNIKARNILLGHESWQKLSYMPSEGLFSERKISTINPKNSNLFHGVWRIPHDEIDRPGSFAAHMYRCVSLCLDILQEMKDFYTVLEVAISLRHSPDKDKKYLRDNERELLFEHAAQVGIQTMKDKFKFLFKSDQQIPNAKSERYAFLIDAYKAYKQMNKYLPISDSPFSKLMIEAYSGIKGVSVEGIPNILREIENYCIRNPSSLPTTNLNTLHQKSTKLASTTSKQTFIRRGRPPGPSTFETFRFRGPGDRTTVGQSIAVQQAYKVYENLIQAQTILNNKNLDNRSLKLYQKKYEEYKQQMLKYLQIPNVSQFFHSSLQTLGTSAAKLPPPPNEQLAKSTTIPTTGKPLQSKSESVPVASSPSIQKHSLSSLAERSKAHGISISAVSKSEASVMKAVKPSMSISLSQSKINSNQISITNISKENTSKASKNPSHPKSKSLLKLPPGTTLSRQSDITSDPFTIKERDPLTLKSLSALTSSKRSVTITQAIVSDKSDKSESKKQSAVVSFQAAFQASLDKSKLGNSTTITPAVREPIISATSVQLQKGIKVSSLKYLTKSSEKRWDKSSKSKSEESDKAQKNNPQPSKPLSSSFSGTEKKDDDTFVITLD